MEYFNHAVGYLIKSKATSNATDVMLAAKELSIGITKLPGSRPLWKVRIETEKDSRTIIMTAMTFAISKIETRLEKADAENRPCSDSPKTAKTTDIAIEATQALKMFFA